jgi:hypothetical protein
MARRVSTPRRRIRRTTAHARSTRRALPAALMTRCHASTGGGGPSPSAPSREPHRSAYRSASAAASGSPRSSQSARTRDGEVGDGSDAEARRSERACFRGRSGGGHAGYAVDEGAELAVFVGGGGKGVVELEVALVGEGVGCGEAVVVGWEA